MRSRAIGSLLFFSSVLTFSPPPYAAEDGVQLGGYGELHANYLRPDGEKANPILLDFHRFVLFFGYEWSDQWSFHSELEFEHNFVEGGVASGELELEQAFVQWRPRDEVGVRAGVVLPSIGLINEFHEPPRFLSVERPAYANVIIPTTWFGNGIAASGLVGGSVDYSLTIMEGLDDRRFREKDGIRSGRLKGFKAALENVLVNGRVRFVGIPGLTVGASGSVNELINEKKGGHRYNRTILWELHGTYQADGIWATAEFGSIHYDPKTDSAGVLKNSQGFYVDLGYDVARLLNAEQLKLYPFVRYSMLNPAGTLGGEGTDPSAARLQHRFMGGIALLPIPQVAVKLDAEIEKLPDADLRNILINAGVGYEF